jgi:TadE-like protein
MNRKYVTEFLKRPTKSDCPSLLIPLIDRSSRANPFYPKDRETPSPAKQVSARSEEGQALLEFAFVFPLLAMLVFGIIKFSILFNNYETLTDAVRVGA